MSDISKDGLATSESLSLSPVDSGGFPRSLDGYIPVLDGVRGVAILLVMAFHFMHPGNHWTGRLTAAFTRAGWVGVDLFFILSGFLITGILIRTKGDPHYFRNFYMRRTLRIFPLYYAVLAFIFFGSTLVPALITPGFRRVAEHQLWLWTYTTNLGQYWTGKLVFVGDWVEANHFWSLAVEEQFYLVWPAVLFLVNRRTLKVTCVCVILSSFVFRAFSQFLGDGFTLCRADALIVGGLVAVLVRDENWSHRIGDLAKRTTACTGLLLAGIFVWRGGFLESDPVVKAIGMSLMEVFFGSIMIVVIALPATHSLSRLLSNSMLKAFGKYSYGIYIFHWALNPLVLEPLFPAMVVRQYTGSYQIAVGVQFILKAGTSFGMAWLSWHLYEKHFLKLKRLFVYAKETDLPEVGHPSARSVGCVELPWRAASR